MDGGFPFPKQSPFQLSEGTCDLPICYTDASWIGVFFQVELLRASKLLSELSGDELEPWPVMGKALAAVYAWEYRRSTIGYYKEVGLGIQARVKGAKPSLWKLATDMLAQPKQGIWVVSLPVTSQAAFQAGVEVWGYPKYVSEVDVNIGERGGKVILADELELTVPRPTVFKKNLPIATYTKRKGVLLRTKIDIRTDVSLCLGGGIKFLGSRGQTVERARALGLEQARVLGGFHSREFVSSLGEGEPVALGD
jgi:hypothetical protein